METIKLTIDNRTAEVATGTNLVEAAASIGIKIPTLCYLNLHELGCKNDPGVCRICVVEVEGRKNLAPACKTVCTEGMVVRTHTPRVINARQTILELILSDHPNECLTCSKNGYCSLQTMAKDLGIREAKYKGETTKPMMDLSPSVVRNMEKCILCRRCETVCNQVQTVGALSVVGRGFTSVLCTAFNDPILTTNCVNCGQCVAVCPTSALSENSNIREVMQALADPGKTVVVQTAPAVRVALGQDFGLEGRSVIRAVNPIRLLREMLKAKKTNYASVPVYLTTFYREGVRYKQKFRNLTEAVFKIYKPSSLLNHSQDHVKLLKMSRIVDSQERDTLIAKMSAGIDACLQLDIVKNLPDFLLPDGKGNVYFYASCDMTVIDNRLVNVISFRQNKGIKEPLYCGELYIDAENNALVQARLEINPAYVRQATDMFIERKTRKWKITAQEVVYTISYRQWNGIYYMNHIRGDLYFKVKLKRQWFSASSLHTWFEMVTCKVDVDNVTRFQRKERMPTRTIFSDTHFKYDADFWGEFNVIPWEEELGTVIEKLSPKIEQIEY